MSLAVRFIWITLLLSLSLNAFGQERVAFTSIDEAGPDYLIQG